MSYSMYGENGEIFYGHDVDVSAMTIPVRCLRCSSGIYDLATVEVTARYTDCSMWKTPCCDVLVDDRTWTGRPDFNRLGRDGRAMGR